jgi:ParB/RepB/Spo0J family partition protein
MSTKEKNNAQVEVNKSHYLMVSPQLIVVNEKENPRQDYGDIQELMLSILENGIRVPLKVYEKNGKYILKNGFRRMRAVKLATEKGKSIERVPVLLEQAKLNEEERTLEHIIFNDGKPLSMLEQSEVIRRLLNFGWKVTDIVTKTGKARGYIENLILLTKAPMKVQYFMRENKISPHTVIQIMQAEKGNMDKVMLEVEQAIESARESGQSKATPKHVKSKEIKSQSYGKFYRWCEGILELTKQNTNTIKPRTDFLEKLMVYFENGRLAKDTASELFLDNTPTKVKSAPKKPNKAQANKAKAVKKKK